MVHHVALDASASSGDAEGDSLITGPFGAP
jgi:hypothetical protein